MELRGKAALVTGGAKRVGRALALALGRAGCSVVIHYGGSAAEAAETVADLRGLGVGAWALAAELADAAAVDGLVPAAIEQAGRLDVLINSASIFSGARFLETDLALWQRLFDVNLRAPFLLSQRFARHLPDGHQGKIVNLVDVNTARPQDRSLAYTLSKLALDGLTQATAHALAERNIQVNGIALGAILPNSSGQSQAEFDALAAAIPAGRTGGVDDVARALLYLLRDADYMTGAILPIDGGLHLT